MYQYQFNDFEVPNPKQRIQFDPYALNGGSVVAIAGKDFTVVGADTRLSAESSIYTRNQCKLFKISSSILGVTGCWCDALTFSKIAYNRVMMYEHENSKKMSTPAMAQMLTTLLYYKRFFPYWLMTVLAGLDEEGKGCVFSYDLVGHCERSTFRASGVAGSLLQPLLDNQIGMNNIQNPVRRPVTLNKAMSLIKDSFICAAERNVLTHDRIQIMTITNKGIEEDSFDLRRD